MSAVPASDDPGRSPGVSAPVVTAPPPVTAFRGDYDLVLDAPSAGTSPPAIRLALTTAGGTVAGEAKGPGWTAGVAGELVGSALRLRLDRTATGARGLLSLAAATRLDGAAFGLVVGEPGRRFRLTPRPGSPKGPLPPPPPIETPEPVPSGIFFPSPDPIAEARRLVGTAWTYASPGRPGPVALAGCGPFTRHDFVDPEGDGREIACYVEEVGPDGKTPVPGPRSVLVGRPGPYGFTFEGAWFMDAPPRPDEGPREGTIYFSRLRWDPDAGAFRGVRGVGHADGADYRGGIPVDLGPLVPADAPPTGCP
jgi:hypothetical protein